MERATLLGTAAVLMLVPAAAASSASMFEMFPPPRTDEFPHRAEGEDPEADQADVASAPKAAGATSTGTGPGEGTTHSAEVARKWADRLMVPPSSVPEPHANWAVAIPGTGEGPLDLDE